MIRQSRMVSAGLTDRHLEFICSATISHWKVFKVSARIWFICLKDLKNQSEEGKDGNKETSQEATKEVHVWGDDGSLL